MKKITLMLFVLFAAATANAAPSVNGATKVDDLCGWYYWYNRQAAANPTANVTGDDLKALYDAGTNKSKYVCFTKVDESTIMIYGMFECPVTATVSLSGSSKYIDIPINQVTGYYKGYGDIVLGQRTWSATANNGAGGYVTYTTVRMYLNGSMIYVSNNWIQQTITSPNGNYAYEKWVIPGYWQDPETQKYTYFNYLEAARNTSSIPYADCNGVMYVTFDKENVQNYTYTSYPVKVSQEGNKVNVQNFCGGLTTVGIDLHADNTLGIEQQTGTYSGVSYTFYPSPDGEEGYDAAGIIEGTGTESKLEWGSFCRKGTYHYQYNHGEVVFTNKDENQFHFPVALTVTDAGWASFSSEKNVDFTQVAELTPYAVTSFEAVAELEPITTAIPANNGVFVKGAAGTYEIPTVAAADELSGTNLLGATSNQTVVGDASTIYALGLKDGKAGLMLVTAGTTIAANKAYLEKAGGGAKSFVPFADGETTAIETLDNVQSTTSAAYNLQGQRVGNDYKGIVVKNGKKLVVR